MVLLNEGRNCWNFCPFNCRNNSIQNIDMMWWDFESQREFKKCCIASIQLSSRLCFQWRNAAQIMSIYATYVSFYCQHKFNFKEWKKQINFCLLFLKYNRISNLQCFHKYHCSILIVWNTIFFCCFGNPKYFFGNQNWQQLTNNTETITVNKDFPSGLDHTNRLKCK